MVKGGFDRTALFQNVEKGFDKLFSYDRQFKETFEYCNTMKNGSISAQLKMQELQIADEKENKIESKFANSQIAKPDNYQSVNKESKQNSTLTDLGLSSALGLLTPDVGKEEELQQPTSPKKKKKRPKRGFRQ